MKKSKFKTLLKEYGYFDVDEAKKPSPFNFEIIYADYKDSDGLLKDLKKVGKKLGFNVTTKDWAGDKLISISYQDKKHEIGLLYDSETYELADNIEKVLKKLKFYTMEDPNTEGSDTFGILVSKSPISKAELKAYRDELVGDGVVEDELNEYGTYEGDKNQYKNFAGGKNPEADKKVNSLIISFAKNLRISPFEAADLIKNSLKRLGY